MFLGLLVLFVLVSPVYFSLGKRELVFVLLVHFLCFARVRLCPFSLPLGVEGWLRFSIVAYPGPFTSPTRDTGIGCNFRLPLVRSKSQK